MNLERNGRAGSGEGSGGVFIRREHREVLYQFSRMTGVELRLCETGEAGPPGWAAAPITAAGRDTGWRVVAAGLEGRHSLAAQAASSVLGELITAFASPEWVPAGTHYHERKLDFLHETSQHVGGLLDEDRICDFVVNRAADLLECERASIMVLEPATGMLRIRASVGVPEEIVENTAVRPGESISGKVFASGRQLVVGQNDPMPTESLGVRELDDSLAFLSVPLTLPSEHGARRQIVGVINLTRKVGGAAFTPGDLRLVQTVAAHTAAQVNNCRLINAERERRRLEQELAIAADIQLRLIPEKPLSVGGIEVAGVCRPAARIGGDFLDYWESDGRLCLMVADVTGHDLAAALLATAFRSVVRAESAHGQCVSEMMAWINRGVFDDLVRAEMQITLCYAEIDLETRQVSYCSCGHPPPLLVRGREARWLECGGLLFGVDESAQFEEESVPLCPGDTLVLYTDGVVEAGAYDHNPFGRSSLLTAVRDAADADAQTLARHILSAVDRHAQHLELTDDVTILAARVLK